jgi:hypothetical protein
MSHGIAQMPKDFPSTEVALWQVAVEPNTLQ